MNSSQIPLWLPQANHSRFDNFEMQINSPNKVVVENLRKYILDSDTTPFYLFGESGSGKTHLLLAAANLSRELGMQDTIYFDCASESVSPDMLGSCMQSACLVIDNIDAWVKNKEGEKALFSVVEQAKNSQKRLVVATRSSVKNNQFTLADLVSRLSSGVVFQIELLDDAGKLRALQQDVLARNLKVDDKVLQHLLTHFARDNHSLFSSLEKLDRASMIEKRKLTIPFVQQVLSR